MAGCDGFEGGLEPGIGFDAVQFRRLDERSDTSSCGGAFIVACEQRVFSRQGNRPGEILDAVAIHLDAAVVEEELEAVPVAGDIGELLAEAGLGRDASALLFQPIAEGLDQRRGPRLSFGETALGRAAADLGIATLPAEQPHILGSWYGISDAHHVHVSAPFPVDGHCSGTIQIRPIRLGHPMGEDRVIGLRGSEPAPVAISRPAGTTTGSPPRRSVRQRPSSAIRPTAARRPVGRTGGRPPCRHHRPGRPRHARSRRR